MAIDNTDLPITHTGSYAVRSMLVTTYNRALTASDTAQYNAMDTELAAANTQALAGLGYNRDDAAAGSHVHFPKKFMTALSTMVYRANLAAEGGTAIKADLASLTAAFTALTAP